MRTKSWKPPLSSIMFPVRFKIFKLTLDTYYKLIPSMFQVHIVLYYDCKYRSFCLCCGSFLIKGICWVFVEGWDTTVDLFHKNLFPFRSSEFDPSHRQNVIYVACKSSFPTLTRLSTLCEKWCFHTEIQSSFIVRNSAPKPSFEHIHKLDIWRDIMVWADINRRTKWHQTNHRLTWHQMCCSASE